MKKITQRIRTLLISLVLLAGQVSRPESASGFSLSRISHKIFTPNGDQRNDTVTFELENDEDELIDGKIFNMSGAEVSDLTVVDEDTLSWTGQDQSGALVPAGIYVYQIESEGKTVNGIIVVAR